MSSVYVDELVVRLIRCNVGQCRGSQNRLKTDWSENESVGLETIMGSRVLLVEVQQAEKRWPPHILPRGQIDSAFLVLAVSVKGQARFSN